jgi:uncharacterized repeat protein (TIGR01451 family)
VFHTCGLRTDGSLECWGDNGVGQASPPDVSPSSLSYQHTNSALITNREPAISGDGNTIAFVSDGKPRSDASDAGGNSEIFIYDVIADVITQVTATPLTVTNAQPSINYDGTRVAFVSDGDLSGDNQGDNPEIFVYFRDTGVISQVTYAPIAGTSDQPSISGDGRRIAFVSDADLDSNKNPDHNPEVFVAVMGTDAITFGQVTSTTNPVVNSHPSINRLGTAIAFAANADLRPSGQTVSGNPEVFLATCEVDLPSANLEVTKQSANVTPIPGDLFSYIITITNTGTSEAFGVVLTDTLPVNVSFSVHSRVPECSYNSGTQTVACYFERLAPGLSETVTIWVWAQVVGPVSNTVEVVADNPGSNDADTEDQTLIGTAADLSILKTVTPTLVTAGEPVTYTLTIRNNRGVTATVKITDVLVADMSYITGPIMPLSANCTWVANNNIECYPSQLARLESISVTFAITPLEEGTITNKAGATSIDLPPLPDPVPSDNYDLVTISSRGGVFLPIILKNE